MGLGVMTPLHRIAPILAEAQQPYIFRQRALHVLIASPRLRVSRRNLQEFERIVERGYARELEPSALDRLQPIPSFGEVVDAHMRTGSRAGADFPKRSRRSVGCANRPVGHQIELKLARTPPHLRGAS